MIEETAEVEIVREYVKPHHRVLEGGTGHGTVTRAIAERAELVVSCEPQHEVHFEALGNLAYLDVLLIPAALMPRGGMLPMYFKEDWWNTSASPVGDYVDKMMVPGVSAEALIRTLDINCLVLDIEGYELELLPLIDLDPIELITFEYHPHKVPQDSDIYLFRYLQNAGFEEVDRRLAHPEDEYPYPPPGLIAPVFERKRTD